ncbi:adenine-specific DNA-methyltransferase [Anaerosolibacter carboniphilus]|uniref:site-specific DNA-methyltransferase (adenine-specific) n=1 Tax=Anaerosolibacter carboniphilus TaxID=1417629 RepID=A0A841L7C1_9FIRM|nr:TaqI-like C-terminal specificity domain-containing protein [Anaerosolibacter carboniphilus]MBB6218972.1 adenine-specific DNA-methyltransferase [Anaerosolibacter carboniphilus]
MIDKNTEERLQKLLKDVENLDLSKERSIVQIFMLQFIRDYGDGALNDLFKDLEPFEIEANELMDLAIRYDDLKIIDIVAGYENYLSSTLREQTGSYYTPDYISNYMIKRSIGAYLHKETGIEEETIDNILEGERCVDAVFLMEILTALKSVKLVDIACGTGIFILQSFNILFKLMRQLYIQLEEVISDFSIKKYIVENMLFAIDVQVYPVMLLRMTLFSLVYEKNKYERETALQINIISSDSLTTEWLSNNSIFKNVMLERGGFDIVIGNPPYLGEKGNKAIFDQIKTTVFGMTYYEGKMDYFYFFIYRGMELLKKQGILCFITTNYFVTADGAVKLRKYMKDHCTFREIINFNHFEIFKSAKGQHNIIFLITKERDLRSPVAIRCFLGKNLHEMNVETILNNRHLEANMISNYILENQERLYNEKGHININADQEDLSLLDKIHKYKDHTLGELCFVNQGIVSGADKITKEMLIKKISAEAAETHKYAIGEGIFVLSKLEAERLGFNIYSELKPMFKNSDIKKYGVKASTDKYILYISNENFPVEILNIFVSRHLYKYKDILDQRRETLRGLRPWYALQWPRNQGIFEGEKIIVPHRGRENRFAYHNGPWYASADVYFITPRIPSISLKLILGQLNSKLMYFWLYNNGKRKGEQLELYSNPLKELPIQINIPEETKARVTSLVDDMIQYGEESEKQAILDQIIYDLYDLAAEERQLIESLYDRELKRK